MATHLVPILLRNLVVVPRHRWTGSELVYESICLAESIHGLFSKALRLSFTKKCAPKPTISIGGDESAWHAEVNAQLQKSRTWCDSDFLGRFSIKGGVARAGLVYMRLHKMQRCLLIHTPFSAHL